MGTNKDIQDHVKRDKREWTQRDRIEQIRFSLDNLAERAGKLAQNISTNGLEISDKDKELCRIAMTPVISETLEMVEFFALKGNMKRVEMEIDRLYEFMII